MRPTAETHLGLRLSSARWPLWPPQAPVLPARVFAAGFAPLGLAAGAPTTALRALEESATATPQIGCALGLLVPAFPGDPPTPPVTAERDQQLRLSNGRRRVAFGFCRVRSSMRAQPDFVADVLPQCSQPAFVGFVAGNSHAASAIAPNLQDKLSIPRNFPVHPASRPASSPVDQTPSAGSPQLGPSSGDLPCCVSAPERRLPAA